MTYLDKIIRYLENSGLHEKIKSDDISDDTKKIQTKIPKKKFQKSL